jgi:hypothetical protein
MLARLQFLADALGLLHHPQRVLAQDFADIGVGIALSNQRLGDLRKLLAILHALGHVRAVEIGAETDVVRAD